MAKFDVTFNQNVKMNKVSYRAGDVAEVDDALLEELQKHNAVDHIVEKKAPVKKPASKKATEAPEDGE